jgi:hypothetical protein
MAEAENKTEGTLYSIVQTEDQEQKFHLQYAYMAPALQTVAPQEGGLYRRSSPSFRDIAIRKSGGGGEDDEGDDGGDYGGGERRAMAGKELKVNTDTLPMLGVAALCRCVYSLVEIPAIAEARIFAIDEMLGIPEGEFPNSTGSSKLSRFLGVAISAMVIPELGRITPDGRIIGVTKESVLVGWLAAKFLRMVSAVVFRMPALSLPASKRKEKLSEPDGGLAKHQELEKKGAYDKQRLSVLQMYSTYISKVVGPAVLRRLAVAPQRAMNKSEVTLLVEVARGVNAIARAYYGNEMRCIDPKFADKKGDDLAIGGRSGKALEHGAAAIENQQGGQLAIAAEEQGGGFSFFQEEEKEITAIRGELEYKMFAYLVPSNVVRVLVHSFLQALRMETQAFAQQRNIANEGEECVKLISSLVQESIQALATCMAGCGDQDACPSTSCDYDVLEAISHAMCAGAQFVPRARVTQLMSEWHLMRHRTVIQEKMGDPDQFEQDMFGQDIFPILLPSERVHTIAYVWVATTKPPLSKSSTFDDLQRRLLVVTSRQNFTLLTIPPDKGVELPDTDEMEVQCSRSLSRVQEVVVHPRIRGWIGLKWDCDEFRHFQAIFFENHYRRKEFVEVLRLVTRFRPAKVRGRIDPIQPTEPEAQKLEIGPKKGITFTLARKDMVLYIRKSAKPRNEARAEAQLVNVSIIKGDQLSDPVEVLIMTRDAIATITGRTLMKYWLKSEFQEEVPNYSIVYPQELEDSDEELDAIPPLMRGDFNEMDDLHPEEHRVGHTAMEEPCQFKKLTGVWFMAEPEPRVTLQFQNAMKILFFSEGDRQRFRQHLASALKNDNEGADDDKEAQKEQGKLWRVKPTAQTELATVTKEVREVEAYVDQHMERLKKMGAALKGE